MLDTITKKRIDDCRDILVGKLPDPKAQIEQITIGLIYKFMDDMDKEAIELGGKAKFFSGAFKKYSWDNLFNTKVTAAEMLKLYSEAIESMSKNPNIPQLFRDIFNNAYLPYRSPETLKLFLKTIGEFEYTHSEKLGDAFEYLLSVMGSQGDAGQFRTPRHIIDFLVAVVNPGKNDTILDPACGTAGFLISAFKHIKDSNKKGLTPDERKKLIKNFVGYDISPDMVRLSRVNLYLHGFSEPHIFEYDTLSSEDRWKENFDVVLANPPFMSPKGGIRPHKKFSISSNRSEVLFVDYIAEHLNPKGRAGIIVPEGVIFQSGTAYKDLRKMLVDNYLYAVVSLPAGVFNPYSGVKTSILLMDKELSKKSKEILFVKIDNDGYNLGAQRNAVKGGQLEDAIEAISKFRTNIEESKKFKNTENTHAVAKTEIGKSGDYNLTGERYKTIQDLSKVTHKIVAIGDVFKTSSGGTPLKQHDKYYQNGTIPWLRSGEVAQGYIYSSELYITEEALKNSSAKIFPINTVLVAMYGATAGQVGILKFAASTNQAVCGIFPHESAIPEYLYLILKSQKEYLISLSGGGAQPNISQNIIRNLKIPLPPLSVQQQIVTEIEAYQKIIDGAKMVVENYKPKIEFDPEWEMVELGEVATLINGRAYKQEELLNEGPIPVLRVGNFFSNRSWYYSDLANLPADKYCDSGDLLYAWSASFGPKIWDGRKVIFHYHIWKIEIKGRIEKKFLYYLLERDSEEIKSQGSGIAMMHATKSGMEKRKFPIPPIEIQKIIIQQIEKEEKLIAANKELIEIFEQKIKEVINKVWQGKGKRYEEKEEELRMVAEVEKKYSNKIV